MKSSDGAIPALTPYADARERLLTAAGDSGGTLRSRRHPKSGPAGETLATDVVRFGAPPGEAECVLLVLSGVHGVEGHAGNGLQQLLVSSGRLGSLPHGTSVVLVHAVNPFGYAWSRRVDHDNIDVNRNFVDPARLPENPLYDEVDALLNPTGGNFDPADVSFLEGLQEFWDRVGAGVAIRVLNGGQYTYPQGVQYGGRRPSWSRRTLEGVWTEHLAGVRRAVCLDIHTGLGAPGQLTVFQTADDGEAAAEMGDAWFSENYFRSPRTNEHVIDHGLLGPGFDDWAARRIETATFVLEFGTLDPVRGITAFRADNWLHNHGDPSDATGQRIAQLMRDQFFVDDDVWRAEIARKGMAAIHTVLDDLGN